MSTKDVLKAVKCWLDRLPTIDIQTLTDNDRCCNICQVDFEPLYYTSRLGAWLSKREKEISEQAVKLPCGHVFGSECIQIWLSPTPKGGNSSSCPCCRREFFDPWPEVYNIPDFEARLRLAAADGENGGLDAFLEEVRAVPEYREFVERYVRAEARDIS